MKVDVQIWDWPLRLFHWLLVLAVTGAYVTGKLGGGLTEWHARFGSLILGLIVFRLIWGCIGSRYARFTSFFPTWSRLSAYVRGEWQGVGHNPVGALAVFALLAILIVLLVTGLFANDDIAFEGPLFNLIDKDLSDKLSGWHLRGVNVLLVLLGLHISAIVFYQRIKKADLLKPMITGKKQLPRNQLAYASHPVSAVRLILSLLLTVSVVWGVWGGEPLRLLPQLAGIQSAFASSER